MNCPRCASATTKEQTKKTALGYRTFRCLDCKQNFNERTGTPFNFLEYPTDIILLVVSELRTQSSQGTSHCGDTVLSG